MIDQEILQQLVPNRFPEGDFPRDGIFDIFREGPARWISAWSAYLRWQLRAQSEGLPLGTLLDQSGFVATGIFRVTRAEVDFSDAGFPVVEGFQFGARLLRGGLSPEPYRAMIELERDGLRAPIREVVASLDLHSQTCADACLAAVYHDEDGHLCGITARHVVQGYRRGAPVPLFCPGCGIQARMLRHAPGYIDAATLQLSCTRLHCYFSGPEPGEFRPAVEGETVSLCLGQSGVTSSTVMAAMSTPSQIKSAAMPQHFLTDKRGYPGDSGSLIASAVTLHPSPDLIGMYLGACECEDQDSVVVNYGFALDLQQAADILNVQYLRGVFP